MRNMTSDPSALDRVSPAEAPTWKASWETEDDYYHVGRGWSDAEEDLRIGMGPLRAPEPEHLDLG